jgi:ATP-dependent RNA helicase SUPV3L1/SUV3
MSDRPTGAAPSRLAAVLGPTNTGKTHLAVERMLGHASGMIGLPLRLLAREIYDRCVAKVGPRRVALITGEEKIVPQSADYFVCTVEAMPLGKTVDFLAIDESQLCADPARGHIFTHRVLHARGRQETMLLGAATLRPLLQRLLPDAEFISRERFSNLSYAGSKKVTRLPPRSAVVAFSADQVYAIAELIRRQRGGAAVVMGSLSPRTRNAQVALYQSGEVDFLVATDAIGMGLNMDVDHVAFAGLRKFDGKRTRYLHPQEVGQIAGRAGRYRRDGTFGVTGEAEEMDDDLVEAVESHSFQPIEAAEWRNPSLDLGSLAGLIRSLAEPPHRPGLRLAAEALDETTLKALAQDPDIVAKARRRDHLIRLWEVCQTPDFRKTSMDEHLKLVRTLFDHLTSRAERVPEDWIAGQFAGLDHAEGGIDQLAQRLAGVRTLAYAANRPDWLRNTAEWQSKLRALEDRLSDTLHERLMQRFIDRRTSVLMRALRVSDEVLAGVAPDGSVTVEGHFVGKLEGLRFKPATGESALEERALRAAATRAVGPEVTRRLGRLAADDDQAFALSPDGLILWRGEAAGKLAGGRPFAPKVALFGELGPEAARGRAARRLEAFVAAEAGRRLKPLKDIDTALASGALKGLARGVAYRLAEAGGLIARPEIASQVQALSQSERRALRQLGVRFGSYTLYIPALLQPEARLFLSAFETPQWRPAEGVSALPPAPPSARALAARGLRAVGSWAVPAETLETLDALLRQCPSEAGATKILKDSLTPLGWEPKVADAILRGLGWAPARRPDSEGAQLWRRRKEQAAPAPSPPPANSPFAALAGFKTAAPEPRKPKAGPQPPAEAPARKPRRRRRSNARRKAAG